MATTRSKRDRSVAEEHSPEPEPDVGVVPEGLSEEILRDYDIAPEQTRGTGFARAFIALLGSWPNVPWTREEIGDELEGLAERRASPGTLDRLIRAAVRAGYLFKVTHKTTRVRVWVAPAKPGDPEEMFTRLNSFARGAGQPPDEKAD